MTLKVPTLFSVLVVELALLSSFCFHRFSYKGVMVAIYHITSVTFGYFYLD
jgi:hypothetical protein